MKKIYTLILAIALIVPATYAQKGLSIGGNGMSLSSAIVNQNSWGNGHEYDFKATFAPSFGFDIGYNFNDNVGIYTGYWFNKLGQRYKDDYDGSNWARDIELKYQMIPIMLKFTGSQTRVNFVGGIGILYAMLKEGNQTWTRDGEPWTENTDTHTDLGASDVTDRFVSSDIIFNLELGARIILMDNLYIDATMNFGYGLKDINDENWHTPDSDGTYNASHNAYGGFKVGIAYVLFGE